MLIKQIIVSIVFSCDSDGLRNETNKCSIEMFIKLVLTLFFKRQEHRKLSWLDKDSDKDQSQFDELFN
jgi:hypothetical protein